MLDPLFPISVQCLTPEVALPIVCGDGYLIASVDAGRMARRQPGERGLLETGQVFLAGEGAVATLVPQRQSSVKLVRFSRLFYDRLAVLFYEPGYLETLFPAGGIGPEDRPAPCLVTTGAREREVRVILADLLREYDERPPHALLMIQSLLVRLFVILGRLRGAAAEAAPAPGEPVRPANLNALIEHIQAHYTDEFSLEELAARLGLAPAYFSRLFHEKTGQPLFEFINSIRIQKACQLLKRTTMPVIEIAYAVGYNNLSFFNRYFRRLMRLSPREYRSL